MVVTHNYFNLQIIIFWGIPIFSKCMRLHRNYWILWDVWQFLWILSVIKNTSFLGFQNILKIFEHFFGIRMNFLKLKNFLKLWPETSWILLRISAIFSLREFLILCILRMYENFWALIGILGNSGKCFRISRY